MIIKILLILAAVGLVFLFVRNHGTNRGGAYAKIGMGLFVLFAIYAVIRPDDVSRVAGLVGVGRGTDLVLYLLVVGFGFFVISTYLRFKELELKYAKLVRAVALADARTSRPPRGSSGDGVEHAGGLDHLEPDHSPRK